MERRVAEAPSSTGPAGEPEDPACTCTHARPSSRDAQQPEAPDLQRSSDLRELIRREAQSALGCTEPAMVALAAARAAALISDQNDPAQADLSITVWASAPILKNGRSVGLPGTSRRGLETAAALGALAGHPELGLRVLEAATKRHVAAACRLTDGGRVGVRPEPGGSDLFARVLLTMAGRQAEVTIEGDHTNVTRVVVDGLTRSQPPAQPGVPARPSLPLDDLRLWSFRELCQTALHLGPELSGFLLAGARKNLELARRVLASECDEPLPGLVAALRDCTLPTPDEALAPLHERARLWCAAAVLARMGGTAWPVLASGGSGNQGLLVSIPVLLSAPD